MTVVRRFRSTIILFVIWAVCLSVYLMSNIGDPADSYLLTPSYATPTIIDGYSPTKLLWTVILIGMVSFVSTIFTFLTALRIRSK